ncbi:MAG: PhnD/SsuA/transferrin family substrate-binding protein [Candidatus Schekmanbacteria bacterium]|nr:PhnD/SsuA/transferrin family substrate-binding protein [Candidatus Schekmanbacteria bacterium]
MPPLTRFGVLLSLLALVTAGGARPDAVADERHSAAMPLSGKLPKSVFFFHNPDTTPLAPEHILGAIEEFTDYLRARQIVDVAPTFFKRYPDAVAHLRRAHQAGDPPWFASLPIPFLLREGYKLGYSPLLCAQRGGLSTYRFVIVTTRTSGIKSLADARGRALALTAVGDDRAAWLSATLFEGTLRVEEYFGTLVETDGPISAVMSLMYRQADVAIVQEQVIARMKLKASRVWQALQEIYRGPPLSYGGVCAWSGAPPEVVAAFAKELTGDLRANPGGAHVLDTFFLDGFAPCGWSELDGREGAYLEKSGEVLVRGPERDAAVIRGGAVE